MKQRIIPEDIREGDLIRVEGGRRLSDFTALEYHATHDKHGLPLGWDTYEVEGYYLLERPERPFEPHWGMVIGLPGWEESNKRAVYINDTGRLNSWLCYTGEWLSDDWAKQKLAEGWVVIAPSEREEGVK